MEGWQRHHLIPRACLRDSGLAKFFGAMADVGFAIDDFATNGILLPSLPSISRTLGLPLHCGPHRYYNLTVIERVRTVAKAFEGECPRRGTRQAYRTLRSVQAGLRAAMEPQRIGQAIRTMDHLAVEGFWNAGVDQEGREPSLRAMPLRPMRSLSPADIRTRR